MELTQVVFQISLLKEWELHFQNFDLNYIFYRILSNHSDIPKNRSLSLQVNFLHVLKVKLPSPFGRDFSEVWTIAFNIFTSCWGVQDPAKDLCWKFLRKFLMGFSRSQIKMCIWVRTFGSFWFIEINAFSPSFSNVPVQ